MGTSIMITSGKGGTGKSTVSCGLALAFSKLNKSVLLVDMDEGLRCLDLLLGVDNNVVYDLGVLYDFGKINSMFTTLMSGDKTDVASHLESIEGAIQDEIDEYVEAYELNG